MGALANTVVPKIFDCVDLNVYNHMVDVGGATGTFSIAAVKKFQDLRSTVFDLPAVISMTQQEIAGQEFFGKLSASFLCDTDPLSEYKHSQTSLVKS